MPLLYAPTIDRRRRFQIPKYPWRINDNHHMANGLEGFWTLMRPDHSGLVNLAPSRKLADLTPGTTLTPRFIPNIEGGCWSLDFPASANNILTLSSFDPNATMGAVTCWIVFDSVASRMRYIGAHDRFEVQMDGTDDVTNDLWAASTAVHEADHNFTVGAPHHMINTYDTGGASDTSYIYKDGIELSYDKTSSHTDDPGTNDLSFGTRTGSSDRLDGAMWMIGIWGGRNIENGEAWSMYAPESRWSILEHYEPPIYFFPAAAGDTTVAVGKRNISLVTKAPAVAGGGSVEVGKRDAAIVTKAPIVTGLTLQAGTRNISIFTKPPVVSGGNIVSVGKRDAAIVTKAPELVLGASIEVGKRNLSVVTKAPTVSAFAPLIPEKRSLSIVTKAPIIQAASNVVQPEKRVISLVTKAPVAGGGVIVSVDKEVLSIVTKAPIVSGGDLISVSKNNISIVTKPPKLPMELWKAVDKGTNETFTESTKAEDQNWSEVNKGTNQNWKQYG